MRIERWLGMEQPSQTEARDRYRQFLSVHFRKSIDYHLWSFCSFQFDAPNFGGILYPLFTQWGSSWTLKLLIDFRVCRRIHVVSWRGCNEEIRNSGSIFLFCWSDVKRYWSFVEHLRKFTFWQKKIEKVFKIIYLLICLFRACWHRRTNPKFRIYFIDIFLKIPMPIFQAKFSLKRHFLTWWRKYELLYFFCLFPIV